MRNSVFVLLILGLLSGCIGTDLQDAPIVGEKLEITPDRVALLIGTSTTASATYANQYGVVETVVISWKVEPSAIAAVDENGFITATAPGQAKLFASYGELEDSVRISVVINENAAASVDISAPKTALNVGESISLSAVVKNINEMSITTSTVNWNSSDTNVVTVDANGLVKAIGNGTASVYGVADGVYSNEIQLTVSGVLTGTFVPQNGYLASGTASLKTENGDLILEFSSDFTTSFALGTYIYLSSSISNGSAVQSGGIELGQISTNGVHTWNVSQLFPGTTSLQYQYVVILCKPANILFGYAQLQ